MSAEDPDVPQPPTHPGPCGPEAGCDSNCANWAAYCAAMAFDRDRRDAKAIKSTEFNASIAQVKERIACLETLLAEQKARLGSLLADKAWEEIEEQSHLTPVPLGLVRKTFPFKIANLLHRWYGDKIEWTSKEELDRTGIWGRCKGVELVFSNDEQ